MLVASPAECQERSPELPPGAITLIVPYPAGGVSDLLARALAPTFSRTTKRPVIVENVGGASGSIAVAKFLGETQDGAHLLVGSPTETVLAPLTIKSLHYRASDLKLLGLMYSAPLAVYARPDLEVDSIDELADWSARSGRDSANYGSPGEASIYHVLTESLNRSLGMKAVHIPYRGGAPLLHDLMGGTIDFTMLPVDKVMESLAGSGKVKVLGVTAARRMSQFPQTPTLEEGKRSRGFGHPTVWVGLFAGQAMSKALSEKLNLAFIDAVKQRDAQLAFESAAGTVPGTLDLEQAAIFYAREMSTLQDMARKAKVSAD